MRVENAVIDYILQKCNVTFRGLHSSGGYPARAYWMVTCPVTCRSVKIVSGPIKSKSPKKATLDKMLKLGLKGRLEAINTVVEIDHYGQIITKEIDPSGAKFLLGLVEGKYLR